MKALAAAQYKVTNAILVAGAVLDQRQRMLK